MALRLFYFGKSRHNQRSNQPSSSNHKPPLKLSKNKPSNMLSCNQQRVKLNSNQQR